MSSPGDILDSAGLEFLKAGPRPPDPNELAGFLRNVRDMAPADPAERGALREGLIQVLKKLKASAPSSLATDTLRRGTKRTTEGPGQQIIFEEVAPCEEEVDGGELLDSIVEFVRRYVVTGRPEYDIISLWVVFTYLVGHFDVAPVLCISSPTKRCGKTRLLEVLSLLVYRCVAGSNITPAAVFRLIEAYYPTLLIDEGDTFVTGNEELRCVLNSGHTRSMAYVFRNVPENKEPPRQYPTFGAKAVALIGNLPATLEDRSLVVAMSRRKPTDKVERFWHMKAHKQASKICPRIARFAADFSIDEEDVLDDIEGLHDRQSDNIRPLLAIAAASGGTWPERARRAALHLAGQVDEGDAEDGVQLLADMRDLFSESGERLTSKWIALKLGEMEHRPWPEWGRQKKTISPTAMARLLKPFGIRPKQVWINGGNHQGYRLEQFQTAFAKYLPAPQDPASEILDPLEPSAGVAVRQETETLDPHPPRDLENDRNPDEQGVLGAPGDEKGGIGGKGKLNPGITDKDMELFTP